ncbi:hypothetical protein C2W62_02955 [Candidatus Entotheonella serta]|nr:hypothetical protein C2W62_02955 [Candidatus Entotheonella serta]
MAYLLEGIMLEVCSCETICPCWAYQDPDGGTCDAVMAYHIHTGTVEEVDVSGLNLVILLHLPGNAMQGNWQIVVFVDDQSTEAQQAALLKAWTGELGGPLADIASLVGQVSGVERAPITVDVDAKGKRGYLRIGPVIEARAEVLTNTSDEPVTLHNSLFTEVHGSPMVAGRAPTFRVQAPQYGFDVELENHSSVRGTFRFEA